MFEKQLHLVREWRERAAFLRRYGADGAAEAFEVAARELADERQQQGEDLLNLQQAAAESGYTDGHLGRLVREGRIPNSGRPNAPLVRRSDLPVKRGYLPEVRGDSYDCDVMQIVQSVAARN